MNPLLDLFLGLFGGLDPADLITGPDESLGTQVWVYDASGNRIELTDPANQNQSGNLVGAGFGNPANKYSWSSAIYDDGNGPDLYVGTFNAFFDYKGGVAAFIKISQQSKVGSGLSLSNPSDLFTALTDNQLFPTLIDTQGGEIWKYESVAPGNPGATGGTWSKVYDASTVPQLGPDVAGFRSMVSFDGKLLAASSSSLIFDLLSINQDQATTISVYDGATWSVLTGGPFDDPNNSSIRTMKQVGDKLLIGTENAKDGAQLWSLDFDGVGGSAQWQQFADLPSFTFTDASGFDLTDIYGTSSVDPASTGDILDLSSFTGLDGKFLIGTWQPYGLYMGDINTPGSYTPIILPENALLLNPSPIDNGVMRMEIYNGYVYIGSVNYAGGTSVFRISVESLKAIDTIPEASISPFISPSPTPPLFSEANLILGSGWEVLTTNGFRSIENNIIDDEVVEALVKGSGTPDPSGNGISVYSWSMKVVNGKLYIGDFSGEAGVARLYEITDTGLSGDASGNFSNYSKPFRDLDASGVPVGGDASGNTVTIRLVQDQFGPEAYGLRTMQVYSPELKGVLNPNFVSTQNLVIGDADPFDSEIGLLNRFVDDPTRQVKVVIGDKTGGVNDDVLFGAGQKVKIQGLAGEDIIIGTQFADRLDGGEDQDLMIGNLGADRMNGGGQSDLMWGDLPSFGSNSLAEGLLIQLRALLLQAVIPNMMQVWQSSNPTSEGLMSILQELGNVNPEIAGILLQLSQFDLDFAYWGEELLPSLASLGPAGANLALSSFNDTMYGDDGDDVMFGGLGDDKMYGGADDDIIIGQQGADSMWGDAGADQLEGGRGRDIYYGGLGNDIYDLRIPTIDSSGNQAVDSSGNMIFQTDNERDIINYKNTDFEKPVNTQETVFGFEQGLDKVDIDKKRVRVSIAGDVATLTYTGKRGDPLNGSVIELTNEEPNFTWAATDFI